MLLLKYSSIQTGFFVYMQKPNFTDLPKSFAQQVEILSERGMGISTDTEHRLSHTNYYRLGEFWKFYRIQSSKDFTDGTTFDTIWEDYRNDRRLRLLIMDAIERIEVSFKTKLANFLATKSNTPYPHLNPVYLKCSSSNDEYKRFLQKTEEETKRSTEEFVKIFFKTYDETNLPIWMLVEVLSFGTVSRYYELLTSDIKKAIAKEYNLDKYVFGKWIHFLSIVRNMCCHHARFWRRKFGWKPPVLNRNVYESWNPSMNFTEVYGLMCILKYFMCIIRPNSRWHNDVDSFIASVPNVENLGFPNDWDDFVPWKR